MMLRMRKRGLAGVLGLLLAVGLAGCPGGKPENTTTPETGSGETSPKTTDKPTGGKKIRVGLVLDTGGVDDKSFNAAANAGLERAIKELGAEGKYVESKDAGDYKNNLTQFATQGYDVVFAVGYLMEDALTEVAPQFQPERVSVK